MGIPNRGRIESSPPDSTWTMGSSLSSLVARLHTAGSRLGLSSERFTLFRVESEVTEAWVLMPGY